MRGKRGTAGQRAHALPMQEPGQERLGPVMPDLLGQLDDDPFPLGPRGTAGA
jgi:hypothetical protein